MERNKLKASIEAILFSTGDAVDISEIQKALSVREPEIQETEIREAAEELEKDYQDSSRGIHLISLGSKYQLCTKKEYYPDLIQIVNAPERHKLTDVLLETLSIVAYRQPVTRMEIEKIRGVSSSHAINKLVDYHLIQEVGRMDAPGHPILFGTTDDFLRSFGISSMDELPGISPDQVEDFRKQAEEETGIQVET